MAEPNLVSGPCIVCGQGTDTALVFEGDAHWAAAGVMVLGVPQAEAMALVEATWDEGIPLDEVVVQPVRVCAPCVARCRASFPTPRNALLGDVPVIRPLA